VSDMAVPPPQDGGPAYAEGRLADEFFLMAHDDESGRTRLPERITGLGLAAALLGELALDERIELRAGLLDVPPRGAGLPAPADDLTARVLQYLVAEQHPVRTWLAFFARTARDDVAGRLAAAGVVARKPRRRPWQPDGWVPTSPNTGTLPAARLVTQLIRGRPLSEQQTVLVGLLLATGLDELILWEVRESAPDTARHLAEEVAALKPSLTELISQTEAAVGAAIASHRT
jgi:Golgi phosphoprotein 3 (GPP34)